MAKARAIGNRRRAVKNIRKITRTMQLIATARFQAAFNRATATKPYTAGITRLVEQLSQSMGEIEHPLVRQNSESGRSALIVLTSNRGLCGGYNSAVLRKALETIRAQEAQGRKVDLHVVGKKGISYFRFLGRPMTWSDTKLGDRVAFADAEAIATKLMGAYERWELDGVYVAYTRFISAGSQHPEVVSLLPVSRPRTAEGQGDGSASAPHESNDEEMGGRDAAEVQYEFSPPVDQLLDELLPEMVKVRLFQCFTDAMVSEHTARMVAMKAATDAAGDMIRSLTQQINRARQSQITLELLDIVGGANALA